MKREVITNMVEHAKSRKRPVVGDLFYIEMINGKFVLGRVIRTDATVFAKDNLILYFYSPAVKSPEDIRPPLLPKLLIPPQPTNRQGWLMGYYTTIGRFVLRPEEILPVHCFEDYMETNGKYCDEYGNKLRKRIEPCGVFALSSYRTIDDDLSEALGIPPAPEDQPA